tara:strand:- start:1594 stop:2400 length:807 start_codon:yes stop_codon:yes gene_type:complete
MKELYSFVVEREVTKETPYIKKTKNGPVESTKKVKTKLKNRVVFAKPSIAEVEDAEFFYGQKFNSYINAGFLTKAMLAKKMGDIGGMKSKQAEDLMGSVMLENMEAAKVIEFFDGAKEKTEEQKEQLKEAKIKFTETQAAIHEFETQLRAQFDQTADARAEQKLIEWFLLKFSFYEDSVEGEDDSKKEFFPLFEGEEYKEKREALLSLQEMEDDIEDPHELRLKKIFDSSFETLIRVITIWYNKIGTDQKSIEEALKEFFGEKESEEE